MPRPVQRHVLTVFLQTGDGQRLASLPRQVNHRCTPLAIEFLETPVTRTRDTARLYHARTCKVSNLTVAPFRNAVKLHATAAHPEVPVPGVHPYCRELHHKVQKLRWRAAGSAGARRKATPSVRGASRPRSGTRGRPFRTRTHLAPELDSARICSTISLRILSRSPSSIPFPVLRPWR